MPQRALLLALLFAVLGATLVGRLFHLQVLAGERYAEAVDESRRGVQYVPARRGKILDRKGTPLVDNRSVYDFAIALADLELSGRARHRIDFLALDESAMDSLVADLAPRCGLHPDTVRAEIEAVLDQHPAVAHRRGAPSAAIEPGLVLIPQAIFVPEAGATAGTPEAGETTVRMLDHGELYESGLLYDDPRQAIERELQLRWGPGALVLSDGDLDLLAGELAAHWQSTPAVVHAVLSPFADPVGLAVDGEVLTSADGDPAEWLLITPEQRALAETALVRFLGRDFDQFQVRSAMRAALAERRPQSGHWDRYLVPSAALANHPELLPEDLPHARAALTGSFATHERIRLIQGDDPTAEPAGGTFSLLSERIAAGLDQPPSEVARLIRRHAEHTPISRAQRRFRVHMLVFDPRRLERLVTGLAAVYRAGGIDDSVLDIEAALAAARRLADREWAGSTRHDPIAIAEDVDRGLAIDLAGSGIGVDETVLAAFPGDYDPPLADLPGLRVVTRNGREYPHEADAPHDQGVASHLIGWLGKISNTDDYEQARALGLDPEGWTGTRGIEAVYDDLLQGVTGRSVRVRTPEGWRVLAEESREPVAGEDIRLTLDLELQIAAEQALRDWFALADELGTLPSSGSERRDIEIARAVGQGRAGMVVLDCRTGGVLAMASTPGFELAEVRRHYQDLLDPDVHPEQPLHDNAAWSVADPGSTMKPLVAMAALCDGVLRPGQIIHTEGYLPAGNSRLMRDHPPVPNDWSISAALQKSSNSYFATVAAKIGARRMIEWYHRFGIGRAQTADIAWQRVGTQVSPDNVARLRPWFPHWVPHDTWSLGIGQRGFASPLQIAVVAATVASGGTIYRPYLWEGAAADAVAERLALPPAGLAEIRRGMELVTEPGGTASWLELRDEAAVFEVAAKTGTAQWQDRHGRFMPNHAWLMGYAPADQPRVAFAIFIHSAGTSGGRACSGVAREVLEAWFRIERRDAGDR